MSRRNAIIWPCTCECGNQVLLSETALLSTGIASCGCTANGDIIGQKYGMLTVIAKDVYNSSGEMQYLTRCDCGNTKVVRIEYLRKSENPNCGCVHVSNSENITGQKFGLLTAIRRVENSSDNKAQWLCQCDCGNTCIKQARKLKTASFPPNCGCLANRKREETFKTHGMLESRIFSIWQGMKDRCTNPKNPAYKYYGGRGIKVCDRCLESFENFYEDMHEGYQDDLQIDRINVDGDYELENCRWATIIEQARNKRNNVRISTYLGDKLLAETAEITGVFSSTIKSRIDAGVPAEFAIVPHLSGKGVRKAVNTIKEMYDEKAPAVWLDGELEDKVDEIMATAEVQAKAIKDWGFGPAKITIGHPEIKTEPNPKVLRDNPADLKTTVKVEKDNEGIQVSWETGD